MYGFKTTGIYAGIPGGFDSIDHCEFTDNRVGFLDLGYNHGGIWLNWVNPSGIIPGDPREPHAQANGIELQGNDNTIAYNIVGGIHNGIGVSKDSGVAYCNKVHHNWVGVIIRPGSGMTTITRNLALYPPTEQACPYEDALNGGFGTPAQWNGYSLNSDGIYLNNAQDSIVEDNICSGCFSAGIELWDNYCKYNAIRYNICGIDSTKTRGLSNGEYGIVIGNGSDNNSVYYNDCCSNKFGGIGLFNAGDGSGSITNNYVTDNYCGKSSAGYYFSQTGTSTFIQGRGIYLTGTDVYNNVIRWNIVSTGNRWYSIEQRPNVGSNTIYSNY